MSEWVEQLFRELERDRDRETQRREWPYAVWADMEAAIRQSVDVFNQHADSLGFAAMLEASKNLITLHLRSMDVVVLIRDDAIVARTFSMQQSAETKEHKAVWLYGRLAIAGTNRDATGTNLAELILRPIFAASLE